MNDAEDHYHSPKFDEPPADSAHLTKAEWRFVAKVFAIATVAVSIVVGAVLALQTTYALKTFSAEGRVAGIVAVSAFREMNKVAVGSAACIAFVCMVDRRTDAGIAPPSRGLFLPIAITLPLFAPLAGVIITTSSVLLLLVGHDQPYAGCRDSIRDILMSQDPLVGVFSAMVYSLLLGVLARDVARIVARYAGWPILKILILSWVTQLLAYLFSSWSMKVLPH